LKSRSKSYALEREKRKCQKSSEVCGREQGGRCAHGGGWEGNWEWSQHTLPHGHPAMPHAWQMARICPCWHSVNTCLPISYG
jgi:hypothetical protein